MRAIVITHTGRTFCAGADLKEQASEGGPAEGTKRMLGLLRAIVERPQAGHRAHRRARARRRHRHRRRLRHRRCRSGNDVCVHRGTARARAGDHLAHHAGPDDRPRREPLLAHRRDVRRAHSRRRRPRRPSQPTTSTANSTRCATHCERARRKVSQRPSRSPPRRHPASFADGAQAMQALSQRLFESEEAREGIMSFLEKRPPRWVPT